MTSWCWCHGGWWGGEGGRGGGRGGRARLRPAAFFVFVPSCVQSRSSRAEGSSCAARRRREKRRRACFGFLGTRHATRGPPLVIHRRRVTARDAWRAYTNSFGRVGLVLGGGEEQCTFPFPTAGPFPRKGHRDLAPPKGAKKTPPHAPVGLCPSPVVLGSSEVRVCEYTASEGKCAKPVDTPTLFQSCGGAYWGKGNGGVFSTQVLSPTLFGPCTPHQPVHELEDTARLV